MVHLRQDIPPRLRAQGAEFGRPTDTAVRLSRTRRSELFSNESPTTTRTSGGPRKSRQRKTCRSTISRPISRQRSAAVRCESGSARSLNPEKSSRRCVVGLLAGAISLRGWRLDFVLDRVPTIAAGVAVALSRSILSRADETLLEPTGGRDPTLVPAPGGVSGPTPKASWCAYTVCSLPSKSASLLEMAWVRIACIIS